jgi:hypothetical protein
MLTPHDADLVRRDSALPGLAVLLDGEAFIDALCSALALAKAPTVRITRLEYRPGALCRVAYEMQWAGQTALAYGVAYRTDAHEKLQAARECSCVPGLLGPGRIVLEDCAAVVSFFPNDRRLRGARCLEDSGGTRQLLAELLPDRPDLWNGRIQGLRYNPEKRYVAAVHASDGTRVECQRVCLARAFARGAAARVLG